MTGAAGGGGGGGGGGVPVPSSASGGQFLLQLLQNPHQSHPEPPSRPPINGAAAPQSHHDPAVAAMGPSVHLRNQAWPQPVNPLYPSTSFLPGFHPSPWAPQGISPHQGSSLAANQLFFSDEFQQLGINGKPDGWKQEQEQRQRQKQKQKPQENMLMFGSLACELGSPEDLQNRNLLDKAMQFNVQKVLEVVEVNGRVDGLEIRSNSGVEIGSNFGRNREFDHGVNSRSPHQWNHHGRHEPRRSTVAEPRRVPPGFQQRSKGPDRCFPMTGRGDLERNVAKEWRARDKLNHHQTYTSDDKVELLKREAPKFNGVEKNEYSRLGLVKQLDQPGPPMGSDLHSVPAPDIEESVASVHGPVEGSGRNGLTREESRSGDEAGGSVYEAHNHLEREDLPEHFADSLVLRDGFGRPRHDSFNQESRSNRSREPQATGQWRKNYRRQVRCRMDIEKWTAPFLAIYESLVPAEEEKAKQKQLLALLEKLVSKEWPRAQLYLYGSCANSFGVSNSDIDVCLAIDDADIDKSELLLRLAEILQSDNLQNVQALTHARVPIVKLKDPATGISCDICINNVLAVVNTKLLRDYGQIDGRLRQLAYIVKHWAKSRGVNITYQGTLSSYAYVIMCIHFLQQRKPAILPCLQEMAATYVVKVDDIECAYFDRVDLLQDFGSQNKESIAQLVWAFFDYWAYRHDYTNDVISVRTGSIISKLEKDWTRRIGRDRHLICIEDPFETSHDLGRVVDKYSIRVLREEFERAANVLQYDPNPCVTLFDAYVPT